MDSMLILYVVSMEKFYYTILSLLIHTPELGYCYCHLRQSMLIIYGVLNFDTFQWTDSGVWLPLGKGGYVFVDVALSVCLSVCMSVCLYVCLFENNI